MVGLLGPSETGSPKGPRKRTFTKEGDRTSQKSHFPRVLLSSVPSKKTQRRLASSHRPFHLEQILRHKVFQDGNAGVNSLVSSDRGMGNIPRSDRCIPAPANPSPVPKVSSLRTKRRSVPIPGHTFRFGDSSSPVHKSYARSENDFSLFGDIAQVVPRRYVDNRSKLPGLRHSDTISNGPATSTRLDPQPSEVRLDTNAGLPVRRVRLRPPEKCSVSTPGKNCSNSVLGEKDRSEPVPNGQATYVFSGSACSHRKDRVSRPSPYEAFTTFSQGPLVPWQTVGGSHSDDFRPEARCPLVVQPSTLVASGSPAQTSPSVGSVHGRFQPWLGGPCPGLGHSGSLVPSFVHTTHKCPRNAGSDTHLPTFRGNTEEQGHSNPNRQYHRPVLPEQAGGNTLSRVVPPDGRFSWLGGPLEYSSLCTTHCGNPQCGCRSALPVSSVHYWRMVPPPERSRSVVSGMAQTRGRLVRDSLECETSPFRIAHSGYQGLESRRHVLPLDGHGSFSVPPVCHAKQGSAETLSGPPTSHLDSSVVARPALVDKSTSMVSVASSTVTGIQQPPISTVNGNDVLSPGNAQATCVVPQSIQPTMSTTRHSELEERIKEPQRSSTLKMYRSRIRVFNSFLSDNNVSDSPTIENIEFFLLSQFRHGKAPSTIEGYRAALANHFPELGISSSVRINRLIKSFYRDRPKALRALPNWDLRLVLQFLMGPFFEPMGKISLKFLTLKTVFFLTFASGSRRSEVHSWLYQGVNFKQGYSEVALAPSLDFLAKNQKASANPSAFSPCIIPALSNIVGRDLPDRTLCPVRALRYYMVATEKIRKTQRRLFISFKKGYDKELSPITISTWLKSLITMAYKEAKPEDLQLLNITAHQVRSMAASWALLGGVSVDQIVEACHWASLGPTGTLCHWVRLSRLNTK